MTPPPSDYTKSELELLTALVAAEAGLFPVPRIEIRKEKRGRAWIHKNAFCIPTWAFLRGNSYLTYYVIHEITHLATKTHLHNKTFKDKERRLLAAFGLWIVYGSRRRAYPHRLLNDEGKTVYDRRNYKPPTEQDYNYEPKQPIEAFQSLDRIAA